MSDESQEVHEHIHLIPNNSDCFCFGCISVCVVSICALIGFLAYLGRI